jgi:hypothetical protein
MTIVYRQKPGRPGRKKCARNQTFFAGLLGLLPALLVAVPVCLGTLALPAQTAPSAQPFDVVIANGHIVDGTGSPWYTGDVGIRDGRVAAIGVLSGAPRKRTLDAHGDVVAPGFIDMLGQSEMTIKASPLRSPVRASRLRR